MGKKFDYHRRYAGMKKAFLTILLLLFFLLCGCQSGKADPADETDPVATVESIPIENVMAGYAYSDPFPSATTDGVYLLTDKVSFMDFSNGKSVVLCAQSGCAHEDNTCSAWLEGSSQFGEYNGNWYTAPRMDDGSIRIDCITYTEQARKTVCTIAGENGKTIIPTYMYFSHGYAYILTEEIAFSEDTEVADSLWRVDLSSGKATELLRCNGEERFGFLGGSAEHVAILYTEYLDEEYQEARYELRLYDFDCLNYQVLCGSEDGFIPSVDPHVCYGDVLLYQKNNLFVLYDLTSGQTTELCEQENVVNYWVIDGKLFTVVTTGKGCTQFYANLKDGVVKELEAQRGTVSIRFSTHHETKDYFVGSLSGTDSGSYYIKKADFYAGRFDNAIALDL